MLVNKVKVADRLWSMPYPRRSKILEFSLVLFVRFSILDCMQFVYRIVGINFVKLVFCCTRGTRSICTKRSCVPKWAARKNSNQTANITTRFPKMWGRDTKKFFFSIRFRSSHQKDYARENNVKGFWIYSLGMILNAQIVALHFAGTASFPSTKESAIRMG